MLKTGNARALRANATNAETKLWRHLRNRGLAGYKFRRQKPIGRYIVDFVCMERGLVVELDGRQHADQEQYDKARTTQLEAYGFRVVRFANYDVLRHPDDVVYRILRILDSDDRRAP